VSSHFFILGIELAGLESIPKHRSSNEKMMIESDDCRKVRSISTILLFFLAMIDIVRRNVPESGSSSCRCDRSGVLSNCSDLLTSGKKYQAANEAVDLSVDELAKQEKSFLLSTSSYV
jgi:hypothetical protein